MNSLPAEKHDSMKPVDVWDTGLTEEGPEHHENRVRAYAKASARMGS